MEQIYKLYTSNQCQACGILLGEIKKYPKMPIQIIDIKSIPKNQLPNKLKVVPTLYIIPTNSSNSNQISKIEGTKNIQDYFNQTFNRGGGNINPKSNQKNNNKSAAAASQSNQNQNNGNIDDSCQMDGILPYCSDSYCYVSADGTDFLDTENSLDAIYNQTMASNQPIVSTPNNQQFNNTNNNNNNNVQTNYLEREMEIPISKINERIHAISTPQLDNNINTRR